MRLLASFFSLCFMAAAAQAAPFVITVNGFDAHGQILPKHAFCTGADETSGHGDNISPQVNWSAGPEGTLSYALIMQDPDVPTDFADAGKKDKEIPARQPRQPFYHWVLADIPATLTSLPEGAESQGVEKDKFKAAKGKYGIRGRNDYTKFMKDDKKMAGIYLGYDGPCPPWNDARPHRYIFTLYALDTATLVLPENFTGPDLVRAMQNHILAQARSQGMYTLNPRLKKE